MSGIRIFKHRLGCSFSSYAWMFSWFFSKPATSPLIFFCWLDRYRQYVTASSPSFLSSPSGPLICSKSCWFRVFQDLVDVYAVICMQWYIFVSYHGMQWVACSDVYSYLIRMLLCMQWYACSGIFSYHSYAVRCMLRYMLVSYTNVAVHAVIW